MSMFYEPVKNKNKDRKDIDNLQLTLQLPWTVFLSYWKIKILCSQEPPRERGMTHSDLI
jgi:hypothetical protein